MTPEPKFEPGDIVTVLGKPPGVDRPELLGQTGEITARMVTGDSIGWAYHVRTPGDVNWWYDEHSLAVPLSEAEVQEAIASIRQTAAGES